jgi:hypothetical protein
MKTYLNRKVNVEIENHLKGSVGIDDTAWTGEGACLSGEEGIDLTSCLTTFGDGPDDERLTASTITGSEDLWVGSSVGAVGGGDVASVVKWKSWRREKL